MTPLRKLHPLDITAGTACLVLVVAALALSTYSNWLGVHVSLYTTNATNQVSPFETLTFRFSQPVDQKEVQSELTMQPSVPGKFDWQNDHTLLFVPNSPYPETVIIHLGSSQIGTGGVWLRRDDDWKLSVRQPLVVYMSYSDPQRELMAISATGGKPHQLTSTDGKVFDFDTSPLGDWIVYSLPNAKNGRDLWLVDRDGQNNHLLLDCGADLCTSPAWSPDGKSIAYNRQSAGLTATSLLGAPHLRIVDTTTGVDRPVYSDPQITSTGALWSPDGNWLASYDSVGSQIRVVNLQSGRQVTLPSALGLLGSWSPDSAYLVYPNSTTGVLGTPPELFKADFQSGELGAFVGLESSSGNYDFGDPAWSPDGKSLLLDSLIDAQGPDQELWLYRPAMMDGFVITDKTGYSYDSFSWDPWGTRLVVQAAELNDAFSPQIDIWQYGQDLKMIADNGISPHWLP
ncbi:MAG TPA: hypothetical protein VMC62_01350 [Longilinea sp.]|nr:hypothetical protein [Longilinea sp.]